MNQGWLNSWWEKLQNEGRHKVNGDHHGKKMAIREIEADFLINNSP